jgi:hypothetical protein
VGLKISCKIVQKNPRLLISLTISISQSNVLPLSKQRSPSFKARYLSLLSSLRFLFSWLFHSLCVSWIQFLFSLFSQFFFPFSSFRDFYPNRTVCFFLTLKSYQLCFFLIFFFFVLLSQTFFFFSNCTVFLSIGVCEELGGEIWDWGTRRKKKPSFFPLPHSPVPHSDSFFFSSSNRTVFHDSPLSIFVLLSQTVFFFFFFIKSHSVCLVSWIFFGFFLGFLDFFCFSQFFFFCFSFSLNFSSFFLNFVWFSCLFEFFFFFSNRTNFFLSQFIFSFSRVFFFRVIIVSLVISL